MSNHLIPKVALLAVWPAMSASAVEPAVPQVVLGIHGGIAASKGERHEEPEKALRAELKQALEVGYAAWQKPGATGLDALEAAIRVLEDSPDFNAGRGAVFTHEGRNE